MKKNAVTCRKCRKSFSNNFRDNFWTKRCDICCTAVVAYGPEIKKHVTRKHRLCERCSLGGERWTIQIFGFPVPLILCDLLGALKTFLVAGGFRNIVGTNVSDHEEIGNMQQGSIGSARPVCSGEKELSPISLGFHFPWCYPSNLLNLLVGTKVSYTDNGNMETTTMKGYKQIKISEQLTYLLKRSKWNGQTLQIWCPSPNGMVAIELRIHHFGKLSNFFRKHPMQV